MVFWSIVVLVVAVVLLLSRWIDRRHPGIRVTRSSPMVPLIHPPGGAARGLIEADQADERRRERQSHQGQP